MRLMVVLHSSWKESRLCKIVGRATPSGLPILKAEKSQDNKRMKRSIIMTIKRIIAILSASLMASTLLAETNPNRFGARMKADDKNGDGKLTQAEFTGPDRLFKQLDEDGDGILLLNNAPAKLIELRGGTDNQPKAESKTPTDPPRRRVQPARGSRQAKVQPDFQNVRYGEHERHVFDLYQAKTESKAPAPCMIWIHGGGFKRGDKAEGSLFSNHFTQQGIHYVTLNYRLSHHAIAPASFHDCARALQFIRLNAAKWNIDKTRIAIGGGSAGAGLSQWLAYSKDRADPNAEDPVLRESTQVSALILLNAQTSYDFRWIKQHIPGEAWKGDGLQQLFGYDIEEIDKITPEQYRLIEQHSPITHFSADAPPSLFFYRRSKDPQIAAANAMDGIHHPIFGFELKKLADDLGVACEVYSVENEQDRQFYHQRWGHAVKFLKTHFQQQK